MSIRERKRMKTLCDNVDCEGRDYNILYRVKMREELGGHEVVWCGECVKRDRDMVAKVIFPLCENCGAVLKSFTQKHIVTQIYDFYLTEGDGRRIPTVGGTIPDYNLQATKNGENLGYFCPYCGHKITEEEKVATKVLKGEVVEV